MILGGGGVGESQEVDPAHRRRRPQEGQSVLRGRPQPPPGHPVSEQRDHAGRLGVHQQRLRGLPRPQRQQHPQGAVLRPQGQRLPGGRLPEGRPQLPLRGTAAARRPRRHLRLRPALRRRSRTPSSATSSSAWRSSPRPPCTRTARTARCWETGPEVLDSKRRATFRHREPGAVVKARLMRPSAVTHTTDVEQRSIELGLTKDQELGHRGRTERSGAGAAGLVHAVRDGRGGDAVGGEVDPGAVNRPLRALPALRLGVARQAQRVLRPPLTGVRPALAGAVRLPGPFDPQIGVQGGLARVGGRPGAQRPARRVAPDAGQRPVAVAAGVDDEVLAAEVLGETGGRTSSSPSSVWKLETLSAKPSAFSMPARFSGSTSFHGSWIQDGLPASRYTCVFGCCFSRTIASPSNCSRSAWYSPGVQPSTMCATASGSSTTRALLSPSASANFPIHAR